MDFAEVRRLTIVALFSDDKLWEQLVLKGGNALNLVYGLSPRTSLDLDFSIEEDFADLADTRRRVLQAVKARFSDAGFVVFDDTFEPKPRVRGPNQAAWWGGYQLVFKLIEEAKHKALSGNIESIRRNALVVGPAQQRNFSVDMSKHEYCHGKLARALDHYSIHVYSLDMIVIEKLRALCQQMTQYPLRSKPSPRARDFYDIYRVLTEAKIDLSTPGNIELATHIFAAKEVPLSLLARVSETREFHRPDWPAVVNAVGERLEDFDFYFDFVIRQIAALKALWVE